MKTILKQLGFYTLLAGLFLGTNIQAQDHYTTISGVVKDKENKKTLESVSISVPGTNIGTVTNADGYFVLKLKDSLQVKAVEISHLGYLNTRVPVSGTNILDETFYLSPLAIPLDEVIVSGWDARRLVEEAINRIGSNYSESPSLLTGFYRETTQKKHTYINIAEAVIDIYKTSYNENIVSDRLQIYKGRKVLSQKKNDTLAIKLLAGPNMSIFIDVVKNPDILLDKETLSDFKFDLTGIATIDDRQQYVVSFTPQTILPYPLYQGKFFIDKETLAFTRAEFSLDMTDLVKVSNTILKRKPAGLRFKPVEVSYIVNYKQRDGKSYLSYIRNDMKFKCDWRRRLFSTNYTVLSEMVVTESKLGNIATIPGKTAFKSTQSLSESVMLFYDENFWEDYNIIEPTESLESAVNKLKKQQVK